MIFSNETAYFRDDKEEPRCSYCEESRENKENKRRRRRQRHREEKEKDSMGCSGCGKAILIFVNTIFGLIGLVFLIIGALVLSRSSFIDQYVQTAYDQFSTYMANTGHPVDLAQFNINELLNGASIAFIAIGVFFFVVGLFGWIGAACKVKCLLVLYALILIVIVIGEIVIVIMLFAAQDTLLGPLKTQMKTTVKDKYTGFNGTDVVTIGFNFAMVTFKCCGIDSSDDFNTSTSWNKMFGSSQQVPIACCILNGTFPDVTMPADGGQGCVTTPTDSNSYKSKGCYDEIKSFMLDKSKILLGVGIGLLVLQVLLIVSACCIYKEEKGKNKVDNF